MGDSLTDALDTMIEEARANIRRLKGFADRPFFPRDLYPTVIDVMHAETLRLDMLRSVYEELGEPCEELGEPASLTQD
ncbi:MAG TPA: hypothetical protein VMD92_10845 [Acidobacteriaceae bacterium]|jgi:hypothetical protein|nr:hypothetical protein [Acidobacteriaceae bacterium]